MIDTTPKHGLTSSIPSEAWAESTFVSGPAAEHVDVDRTPGGAALLGYRRRRDA